MAKINRNKERTAIWSERNCEVHISCCFTSSCCGLLLARFGASSDHHRRGLQYTKRLRRELAQPDCREFDESPPS